MPTFGSRGWGKGPDSHITNYESQTLRQLLDVPFGHYIDTTMGPMAMTDLVGLPTAAITGTHFLPLEQLDRPCRINGLTVGATAYTSDCVIETALYQYTEGSRELEIIPNTLVSTTITSATDFTTKLPDTVDIPRNAFVWVGWRLATPGSVSLAATDGTNNFPRNRQSRTAVESLDQSQNVGALAAINRATPLIVYTSPLLTEVFFGVT